MTDVTIAFSTKQRRPGCVLIQAALGATISNRLLEQYFPTKTWLLAPTDDMQVYAATEATLEKLSRMAKDSING